MPITYILISVITYILYKYEIPTLIFILMTSWFCSDTYSLSFEP